MEHITPIKEIDSIKDDFTIKGRIIHLWTQKSKFDANDTYSIEMILMMRSGIKMIASKQDTKHNDFLKNHMFSNIDDLFEPLEEKTVIIVGTVKGIRQNIRWYYLAYSNCKKSAKEKESSTDKVDGSHEVAEIVTYECANPKCKNIQISVIPRYCLLRDQSCQDLDEMENLSTSKTARLSPPDEQPIPLLVSKKEK
uniref:Replication protein A OB domain-containing protein n=1 Tax=Lactuca sativa TaxID=4236 RepID=A0A9R1VCW4_LACSA|nr:hypothetical protein LSAT_V11C500277660 [Lactuca sativa]